MADAEQAVAWAWRCARASGVSRLADITGLDVLGVPVFQAVRPWSRALSVHQGKGLTQESAQVGALMEAVESRSAEDFAGEALTCAFDRLPPGERADAADDFAPRRGSPSAASHTIPWTVARTLEEDAVLWAPWWSVSLDFTREGDGQSDRSSNGLAAHFTREAAMLAALCELLERDALAEWRAVAPHERATCAFGADEAQDPWLGETQARARAAGLHMTFYGLRSLTDWPVAVCVITEPAAFPRQRSAVHGSACRPDAAAALRAAVLEAVQSRATSIAAVRDDILPGETRLGGSGFGFAPPLPRGAAGLDWRRFSQTCAHDAPAEWTSAVEALARAGYRRTAVVDLPSAHPEAAVVKVFAPGLGAYGRRRRPLGP